MKRSPCCAISPCAAITASGEAYGCELELPQCIAKGDPICALRYVRKK